MSQKHISKFWMRTHASDRVDEWLWWETVPNSFTMNIAPQQSAPLSVSKATRLLSFPETRVPCCGTRSPLRCNFFPCSVIPKKTAKVIGSVAWRSFSEATARQQDYYGSSVATSNKTSLERSEQPYQFQLSSFTRKCLGESGGRKARKDCWADLSYIRNEVSDCRPSIYALLREGISVLFSRPPGWAVAQGIYLLLSLLECLKLQRRTVLLISLFLHAKHSKSKSIRL